jgi:hypothetical protein
VPTNENNFEKIQEILDYLMVEFPEGSIEHKFVGSRAADIIFLSIKDKQTQIGVNPSDCTKIS